LALCLPWGRNKVPLGREGRHARLGAAFGTCRESGPYGQPGEVDDPKVGGEKRGRESSGGDPDPV